MNDSAKEARDYCFVIMSYKPAYDLVYDQLSEEIERHTGLRCIRADRDRQPGRALLVKVHQQILGASIVLAEVSEYSPNVYYEYGYSSAHDRLPVLIARKGRRLPTDLVGKEVLRYRGLPRDDGQFLSELLLCIDKQLRSPLPEQRRMLASLHPFPAYLITAPRVPDEHSKHLWHPDEQQTFGDMIGITGILTAYGNLFGIRQLPELLHARHFSKDVLARPANFFCIGSPKVNPATEAFLSRIQHNLTPQWTMPKVGSSPDPRVIIQGDPTLDIDLAAPVTPQADGNIIDYGLIIRTPHPSDPRHLILIVAGRHSIGTHAACLVVTHREYIALLEQCMPNGKETLRNVHQPIWAIVRGTLVPQQGTLSDVQIVKAGTYGVMR